MSKARSLTLDHSQQASSTQAQEASALDLSTRERFEDAVRPLWPRLYRACLVRTGQPSQAEDLLQSALIKAYTHRHSFENRGSLTGWLLHIIKNEHIELCRKEARRRSILDTISSWLEPLLSPEPCETPEELAQAHIESTLLLECIHTLEEPFRTIIFLCDIEEMSQQEIAQLLDIPIGTIKSRHARGRARLLAELQARTTKRSS